MTSCSVKNGGFCNLSQMSEFPCSLAYLLHCMQAIWCLWISRSHIHTVVPSRHAKSKSRKVTYARPSQCSPWAGQPTAQPSPGQWALSPAQPGPIEPQDFEAQAQPTKEITILLSRILLRTGRKLLPKGNVNAFVVGLRSIRPSNGEKSRKYYVFGIL